MNLVVAEKRQQLVEAEIKQVVLGKKIRAEIQKVNRVNVVKTTAAEMDEEEQSRVRGVVATTIDVVKINLEMILREKWGEVELMGDATGRTWMGDTTGRRWVNPAPF